VRGNPAAGILLLVAGIVGFLALVSGNLDKWLNKATNTQGVAGGVFGPSQPSNSTTASAGLSGGVGSRSSAAANPAFAIQPGHPF